jgi:hypothetical protein
MQSLPLLDAPINSGVKDKRVQSNKSKQYKFESKCRVGVHFGSFGPKEQKAAHEHETKARPREREDRTSDPCNRYGPEDNSQHAKIKKSDGAHYESYCDDVNGLDNAVRIV